MLKFKESFGSISVQTQSTYYTYFCYRHYTTCFSKHRPSYNNFNTISYISTYCYMPVILNLSSWYKRFWCNCYKYIKKDQILNTNPKNSLIKTTKSNTRNDSWFRKRQTFWQLLLHHQIMYPKMSNI